MINVNNKNKILFVLHVGKKCGVHDYGEKIYRLLTKSNKFTIEKIEASSIQDITSKASEINADIILYNFHSDIMTWINPNIKDFADYIHIAIQHEVAQENIHEFNSDIFDFHLSLDPTLVIYNPIFSVVPRIIESYNSPKRKKENKIKTIGSFGFLTKNKRFDKIVEVVNEQFDEAIIRFNISPHDSIDIDNNLLQKQIDICNDKITKEKIHLQITNEHFSNDQLLSFLSENDLNFFYYENDPGRGISSVIDYALSVDVPIAVNSSSMFRHILHCNPSPCIDNASLQSIIDNGTSGLIKLKKRYATSDTLICWENAIHNAINYINQKNITPDQKGFNKILDDYSRNKYADYIEYIENLCPETFKKKIPEANIQQAFVFHAVRYFSAKFECPEILAIGSYEDTASEALKAVGYKITEIDPGINIDLHDFYLSSNSGTNRFEIIICTSVLEHIEDDEYFMSMVGDMLAPGGYGVFTVDFLDTYKQGDIKPTVDYRLYTSEMLEQRIMASIPDCALIDEPSWKNGTPDFFYENCKYNFASLVFKKFEAPLKLYFSEKIKSNEKQAWKRYALYSEHGWETKVNHTFFSNYKRKNITINDVIQNSWNYKKNKENLSVSELRTDIFEKKMQERDKLIRHLKTQNRMLRIGILGFKYIKVIYNFLKKSKK